MSSRLEVNADIAIVKREKRQNMLLTCPHCETIFRVDAADIKSGGRHVRCSVCTHVWTAKRGGADLVTEEADLVEKLKSWRGITAGVALVIALTAVMTMNRNIIGANLPATIPFYESVGLAVTPRLEQLEVARLSATRKRDTIRVSGEVNNLSDWSVLAPALLVTVTDNFGLVLGEKSISLDLDIIDGAASIPFATQISLDQSLENDDITEIVVIPITALR